MEHLRKTIENVKFTFHENGQVETESWFKSINITRTDGPAFVEYNNCGLYISEEWYIDGELHRVDGPAVVKHNLNEYTNNERVLDKKLWYKHGKLHRVGGEPAVELHYVTGSLLMYGWYEHGEYHRSDEDEPSGLHMENYTALTDLLLCRIMKTDYLSMKSGMNMGK